MPKNDDYIEVEAVIRMPKDGRLADSKDTEGWSRGFTKKTSDKGPEHVEIRLKDSDEADVEYTIPLEPDPDFTYFPETSRQKTPEEEELEELLILLVQAAIIAAARWAKPHLIRLWECHLVPFIGAKRNQFVKYGKELLAKKRSKNQKQTETTTPVHGSEASAITEALEAYEANMTSAELRQHLADALVARLFLEEKMRLLEHARINADSLPREIEATIRKLTPNQVRNALDSILESRPAIIHDLGLALESGRKEGQRQLGAQLHTALRLMDDR